MIRNSWTEQQLIEVLKIYCLIPFGKIDARNAQIIDLAAKIGRSSNAIALKMANFASLDPTIDRKGLENYSKLDKEVWDKFINNIDYYISDIDEKITSLSDVPPASYVYESQKLGTDIEATVKARRGQDFFRCMILASYDGRCALSGVREKRLLVASHITPWAADPKRRLDPRNGICLNALLDKAFDNGIIAFSDSLDVLISSKLEEDSKSIILNMISKKIRMPTKFGPDIDLIRAHRHRFGIDYLAIHI